MAPSIVQSASARGGAGGLTLTLPAPVTVGNVLVYRAVRRKSTGGFYTPSAPSTSGAGPNWGTGAWTDLTPATVRAVRDGTPTDISGIAVYAKIADSTNAAGFIGNDYLAGSICELADVSLSDVVVIYVDQHASGTDVDIGSLGSPAAGSIALLIAGIGANLQAVTVTPGSWIRDLYTDAFGWGSFAGDVGSGGAWPYSYLAHQVAAGGALEAQLTLSAGHQWGGLALVFPELVGPQAAFSADPTEGCETLEVTFTDLSTGSPTSWLWDFGDGDTSTDQNPVHTYTEPGYYTVSLTATNMAGENTTTSTELVHVCPPAEPGIWLDWDGDGFDRGDYDETTPRGMSWVITRGASPELTGGSQPGSCTLVLRNRDDRFNPENDSSPVHDQLRDGVPLWIGVNDQGRLVGGTGVNGLFGGRLTEITPIPAGGAEEPPTVEMLAEDALGWYGRTPVRVVDARDRSQADLRLAALVAAGETRYDLPAEPRGLPLSSADGQLASVLDAINAANGTRHFAKPADSYTDWYAYTARDRMFKVGAAADASLDAGADHVISTSGWRKTAAVVINEQKATITPLSFPDFRSIVWQAETLPIIVHSGASIDKRTIWATFDDFVDDAEVEIASTTGTTATLTSFGRSAKIVLSAPPCHVTRLVITGRKVRRGLEQSVVVDDLDSQLAPRGVRAGSELSGDYIGSIAAAHGFATHIVWRFGEPQYRPTLTVVNWLPYQFQLDLFDLVSFTSSQIGVDDRLFEIVGLQHTGVLATAGPVYHEAVYTLQECRVQEPIDWFTWDVSDWDGVDNWAYL